MAKINKKWHKKHISTKWGILIIAILLLGLIVLIPQIGNSQNIFGRAMYYVDDYRPYRADSKTCYHSKYNCGKGMIFVGNKCVDDPCYGARSYSYDRKYCYGSEKCGIAYGTCANPACSRNFHRQSAYGTYWGYGFGPCVQNDKVACKR